MPARGSFIVIEGIDGAGTTTQAALLTRAIEESGRKCTLTREPSDGPVGGLIRDFLEGRIEPPRVAYGDEKPERDVLALLFTADRLDHLRREIEPALADGRFVVCDRYFHSTCAYQMKNKKHLEWIILLHSGARVPDITFYIDLPPEAALERTGARGRRDLFETLEQLRRIRAAYKKTIRVLRERGDNILVVDGGPDEDSVFQAIMSGVKPLLK